MKRSRNGGFTAIELIIAGAMAALLYLAAVRLIIPILKYFHNSQARQMATQESRKCLETIQRVMENGVASTLVLPAGTPAPHSTAKFTGLDGSRYAIFWSSAPSNTVYLQRTPAGSALVQTNILAQEVAQLHFLIDTDNPGIVRISLEMRIPLDRSGSDERVYKLSIPEKTIAMVAS